ncbi:T9SS type A sorting domain-containing protein [Apibacter sp. HY039]|uniref:T9SS type A sorting domain-containing protein n=1 Tax=Apibacter sp. HY039 TaxID=2501476 RepID=UPI000FEBF512|nr:T9SS type A sorting domain-containing protein [Apibacter sp. HY039]
MKKNYYLLFLCFLVGSTFSLGQSIEKNSNINTQKLDESELLELNAPNSYIYDVDIARNNSYGGLEIPVVKAFAMWKNNEYLQKPLPQGKLSASIYWEDVEGLIRSTTIDQNGKDSKIKVIINNIKGKGNAVIALHIGDSGTPAKDPVYWSWHIWVTDDPTKGITYDNNPGSKEHLVSNFMDRNLGAVSNAFVGNDWNRSGGLMYQWGRKDPFPSFVYKDGSAPTINSFPYGKVSNMDYSSRIQKDRPFKEVNANIQESIKNPFTILTPLKSDLASIKNSTGQSITYIPDSVSWVTNSLSEYYRKNNKVLNLWADNTDGKRLDHKVYTQKQKSPYDPCPSGWRVPTFAHQFTDQYDSSPWGKSGSTPQVTFDNSKEGLVNQQKYSGVKIYPGLGFDFTKAKGYNLGMIPTTGHYIAYGNKMIFQDEGSETYLWSGTLNEWGTASVLHLVTDFLQNSQNGAYSLYTRDFTSGHTSSLNAIRCVKEDTPVSSFTTQYIMEEGRTYTTGLENPNSYLLVKSSNAQQINIPVNKAFAVYNQYLTEQQWPEGKLSTNIYWSTDVELIEKVTLSGNNENGNIVVKVNPNKSGNAVVSLHSGSKGNSEDPILWSWHIWVSNSDPTTNTATYSNQERYSKKNENYLAFNTSSGSVPLTTTFMDRNLGAIDYDLSSDKSNAFENTRGLLFQWGRKDPMPVFILFDQGYWGYHDNIYLGSNNSGKQQFNSKIERIDDYEKQYILLSTEKKLENVLLQATRNPLSHIYRGTDRGWLPDVYQNMWGHAEKKSPFDPCPEGWRVPDFANAGTSGSPWYKEGMGSWKWSGSWNFETPSQTTSLEALSGKSMSNKLGTIGVMLTSAKYNLGHFPSDGGRGIEETRPFYLDGLLIYGQNWSATMYGSSQSNLRPLAMAFGTGKDGINPSNLVRPRTALPVRCAKDEIRFTQESITKQESSLGTDEPEITTPIVQQSEEEILVTPNPTTGVFKIKMTKVSEGSVQLYNMNGSVVHTQDFRGDNNLDVNIQNLPTGVYIAQVKLQGKTMSRKIIKNQ